MSALPFPLALAQWQDLLRQGASTFELDPPTSVSRTGGGEILRASMGAELWRGVIEIAPSVHADAMAVEARLALLREPQASFLVRDPRYQGPRTDPGGVALGVAIPEIDSLDGDNRRLSLKGLPPGYVLSPGDMVGWQHGTAPVRYALHRLVTGATANSSGVTPLFEVVPRIRGGAADTAVEVVRPVCKAVLGESMFGMARRANTAGASFEWVQTFR